MVTLSQREAKALGNDTVSTQHLLLGLIAESRDDDGFLGTGITVEVAREAVTGIWHSDGTGDRNSATSAATDVAFDASTKRVFEAAVEYSRSMGHSFIAPEHIAVGLFTVDDGGAGRVLERYTCSFFCVFCNPRCPGQLICTSTDLINSVVH